MIINRPNDQQCNNKSFVNSILDITVKTISEEYTPLHLAAHFKPPRTRQESMENDRTEAEANDNLTSSTMIEYLLKKHKGVDAHVSQYTCILRTEYLR